MKTPRRLLVRSVNWLGDAVMTTPALLRLREALPSTRILLWTPENLKDLWEQHPALDEVVSFAPEANLWARARRLRALDCDAGIALPNSPRSALELWLAGIPRRIGYARPWRNWLLTQAVPERTGRAVMRKRSPLEIRRLIREPVSSASSRSESPSTAAHQIYEYLHLAAALGANPVPVEPQLAVTESEVLRVEKLWLSRLTREITNRLEGARPLFLGLNPSAAYGPAKCWPAENFAASAGAISQKLAHCVWLVFGGKSDAALGDQIALRAGPRTSVLNLAGKTTLRELMAGLTLCRVVLTNDSGPMHVAAGLGTPVVAIFGSTSPELTGPGLPGNARHRILKCQVPCSPCFRRECPIDLRCLRQVSVEQAVEAVMQSLAPALRNPGGLG